MTYRLFVFGVAVTDATGIISGVGVIKITLIELSAGIGDTTFFPVTTTPMTIMIRSAIPTRMEIAAIVLVLSSI